MLASNGALLIKLVLSSDNRLKLGDLKSDSIVIFYYFLKVNLAIRFVQIARRFEDVLRYLDPLSDLSF